MAAQRGDAQKRTRFLGGVDVTLRGSGSSGNDPEKVGDGTDVGLKVQLPTGQTANAITIEKPAGTVVFALGPDGGPAPSAGLGILGVAHAIYSFATDGGASCTPALNATIPAGAILIGATVNPTTAPLAAGSATVGVGTTAGSTSTSILAATAKATLSIDALINGVPTLAAPVKLSAAGQISILIATGPLTAGVIEIFVYYVLATNL
jgi:hypothetical protein